MRQARKVVVLILILQYGSTHVSGRVSTEGRRIPWFVCFPCPFFPATETYSMMSCRAPRVIAPRELEVMVKVDDKCLVEASIAFQVFNFKLQQDGDVLYRYEDGSLLQDGQLGRYLYSCLDPNQKF